MQKLAEKFISEAETKKTDNIVWIDDAKVLAIETNDSRTVNILSNFDKGDVNNETSKQIEKMEWNIKAKVSAEYLRYLLEMIKREKITDVVIHISNDYPVKFELKDEVNEALGTHTNIILAPKVDD